MPAHLTAREKEILRMITEELSSCEIARRLELSIRTVETHRVNIYRKTQSGNLVGLIKYSIRMGMMEGFTCTSQKKTEAHPVVHLLQHTA